MTDIVDTAVQAGIFKTLLAAIQFAGLMDTLKSPGPFTILAPTDEAFSKLPPGALDVLLGNIPELTKVLTYHVVPGKILAGDIVKMPSVKSVEGSSIKVDASQGVRFNDSHVITPDIECDNGVIHVIDAVLLPA